MGKRYTAQEMREMALVEESYGWDVVAKMLRQSADELEREKRYEYGAFGRVFSTLNAAMLYAGMNSARGVRPTVVRREVGEWEEVPNED